MTGSDSSSTYLQHLPQSLKAPFLIEHAQSISFQIVPQTKNESNKTARQQTQMMYKKMKTNSKQNKMTKGVGFKGPGPNQSTPEQANAAMGITKEPVASNVVASQMDQSSH